MNIEFKHSRFFKLPYISIGSWNLSSCYGFPKEDYLSADTETQLYYKNKLLSESNSSYLYQKHKAKWCRENIEVRTYAYMLSNGKDFALFQCAEDFLTACAMFKVKTIFWYNARFDFSIFDYYFLTHEWKSSDERVLNAKQKMHYGKLPPYTFQCLNGDFGQRYQMKVWMQCLNENSQPVTRSFKMIDICNIFGGGLKKNLEDWKIKDFDGNDVRKLEMDYVNVDFERDMQYMINDTKGLHLLALTIDSTIKELTGLSLLKGDYITAGGLAKKVMLKHIFGKDDKLNKDLLHSYFPITLEEDQYFRKNKLYQGGKCFVNPRYVNKEMHNIYKYDVNSMYPNQMRNMFYPIGKAKRYDHLTKKDGYIYVLSIKNVRANLKSNCVPVWYDTITGDYVSEVYEEEERLIWLEELEELKNWYNIKYKLNYVLEYKALKVKGCISYVDLFYKIKKESKGAIRNGAKLFLNSGYGKWSQRVEIAQCNYVLSDEGYVVMERGEEEIDLNNMMSVLVGSRITALARCDLMFFMRSICKNNTKEYFVYCDTDSVHSLLSYENCDDKELGKMKCEGVYECGLYLAPKTYLMYNKGEYEVHSKGVNTSVIEKELIGRKLTPKERFFNPSKKDIPFKKFSQAKKIFQPNKKFKCLSALNCVGGKALIKVDKLIAREENVKEIKDDELIYYDTELE